MRPLRTTYLHELLVLQRQDYYLRFTDNYLLYLIEVIYENELRLKIISEKSSLYEKNVILFYKIYSKIRSTAMVPIIISQKLLSYLNIKKEKKEDVISLY